MFLPLFIAILLGLVNPSTTSTPPAGAGTIVNINNSGEEDPGDEDPSDEIPGDDTGGEGSPIRPK